MSKTIHKYTVNPYPPEQVIEMPIGARFLHAGNDPRGQMCIWAQVDVGAAVVPNNITVYGTGQLMDDDSNRIYLGSVLSDTKVFMWHIFAQGFNGSISRIP